MRAVGGMPLAILLAASWVRLLPVTDMVPDVTHLRDLLEQAEEGEERPEHRSVRATFRSNPSHCAIPGRRCSRPGAEWP